MRKIVLRPGLFYYKLSFLRNSIHFDQRKPPRPPVVEKINDEITISGCHIFSDKFGPISLGPCTMNVRNEPVHDIACVVKCETPPVWSPGGNFVSFDRIGDVTLILVTIPSDQTSPMSSFPVEDYWWGDSLPRSAQANQTIGARQRRLCLSS